jgi:hypothetical protein
MFTKKLLKKSSLSAESNKACILLNLYVCVKPFECPNWKFSIGDLFHVIDKTSAAPFDVSNVKGNWIVDGPNGVTVWSQLDIAIAVGFLKINKGG